MSRHKRNNFTLSYEQFTSSPCYVNDLSQLLGKDRRTITQIVRRLCIERTASTKPFSVEQVRAVLHDLGIDKDSFNRIQQNSLQQFLQKQARTINL